MIPSLIVIGTTVDFELTGSGIDIKLDGGKLYPDKDDVDTYIYQDAADKTKVVVGGVTMLDIVEAGVDYIEMPIAGLLQWASSVELSAATDGKLKITNDAAQGILLDVTSNGVLTLTDEAAGSLSLIVGSITPTDIVIGSDATGDLTYKASATTLARLGAGAAGQVLSASEATNPLPEWTTVGGTSKACHVFEDFLGGFTALLTANRATDASLGGSLGPWEVDQTETTGNGLIHELVDEVDGHFKLGFSADAEVQCGTLYWGDVFNISADKNPIITMRLKVVAGAGGVLDSASEVSWGLCSAQNDDSNACTYVHSFAIDGANAALLVNSDDNATPDQDNDSTAVFTDNTFWEFQIDLSDPADVQYKYRATLGGAWTTALAGTAFPAAAAAELQPFVQIVKGADTNVDSVHVDYIEVQWDRT